jgi:hypothetical protein
VPDPGNQPDHTTYHTFGNLNVSQPNETYDWLVHHDRQLTGVMELLHVSAYKPHELTQKFIGRDPAQAYPGTAAVKYQHRAPWFDEDLRPSGVAPDGRSHRFYRLFEYLDTTSSALRSQTRYRIDPIPPESKRHTHWGRPGPWPTFYIDIVPPTSPDPPQTPATTSGPLPGDRVWNLTPGCTVQLEGPGHFTAHVLEVANTWIRVIPDAPGVGGIFMNVNVTGLPQPGKINLNMVTDVDTFRALCDAQTCNTFNPTLALITTNIPVIYPAPQTPGPPFPPATGLATPPYTYGFKPAPLYVYKVKVPGLIDGGIINGHRVAKGQIDGVTFTIRGGDVLELNDPFKREYFEICMDSGGPEDHKPPEVPEPGMAEVNVDTGEITLPCAHAHAANPTFPIALQLDNAARIFANLRASRDNAGRPFLGMAAGQTGVGAGLNDTFLRGLDLTGNPGGARLLEPWPFAGTPTDHPASRFELLSKIYGNVTPRSNAFAVWCTVGFFEVYPGDHPSPALRNTLGPELGRADGRHKRHRFFAIVDRTVLDRWVQVQGPEYEVRSGYNPAVAGGPTARRAGLLGNAQLDPRKDYTKRLPGATINALGPPAPVLHWTVIE